MWGSHDDALYKSTFTFIFSFIIIIAVIKRRTATCAMYVWQTELGWVCSFIVSESTTTDASMSRLWSLRTNFTRASFVLENFSASRRYVTSNRSVNLNTPQYTTLGCDVSLLGRRSLLLLWNSLPLTVRDMSLTFTGFCSRLKTELYKQAYDQWRN